MNTPPIETAAAVETVKEAITARSLLVALKDNRIEVLLAIGILHLLGVSDRFLAHAASVCAV